MGISDKEPMTDDDNDVGVYNTYLQDFQSGIVLVGT